MPAVQGSFSPLNTTCPISVSSSSDIVDEEEEDEDESLALEIFPDGEELAIAIAEDLWPNAIKYFSKSHIIAIHCHGAGSRPEP